MIETNKDRLLEIAVVGEVVHSVVEPSYMTNWDSTPTVGLGRGGIIYNVKPGDPCFGWAWGEKVEPGVSADGTGSDGEKNSFRSFSCIGNEARVVDGEAKGGVGVVVGKVGYLPEGGHHLVLRFEEKTLEKLAIGDKIQVKTCGVGLEFKNHPGVRAVGLSPRLLEKMGLGERGGRLTVPVTKVVHPEYVGQGSGGSPAESNNWDVMTQSPDAVEALKDLRLGDVVCLRDILTAWGRGYYEGAYTVGVVSCGASGRMGQGIGVTTIMTCKDGEIEPVLNPEANIVNYLGLGGE